MTIQEQLSLMAAVLFARYPQDATALALAATVHLMDPTRCPDCGEPLKRGQCPECAADLLESETAHHA